ILIINTIPPALAAIAYAIFIISIIDAGLDIPIGIAIMPKERIIILDRFNTFFSFAFGLITWMYTSLIKLVAAVNSHVLTEVKIPMKIPANPIPAITGGAKSYNAAIQIVSGSTIFGYRTLADAATIKI